MGIFGASEYRRGQLLLLSVFLVTLPFLSWAPSTNVAGGDGTVIYAYVRSIVMDGDLQLENEYRYRWPMVGLYGLIRNVGTDQIIHSVDPTSPSFKDDPSKWGDTYGYPTALFLPRTATGYVANQHPIGPAVLWLPFFLLGHALALALNAFAVSVPADGYSLPYSIMVSLASAMLVLIAMLLVYEILARLVQPFAAALAVVLVYLASPLVVYAIQTPISAHGPIAFASALFLFLGLETHSRPVNWRFFLWGLAGGLMIIVRFESAVLFALAASVALAQLIQAQRQPNPRTAILNWCRCYILFSIGVLVGLLPQMAAGQIIYGFPYITFYPVFEKMGPDSWINFMSPHWWDVLWSANHGLFSWHPILLVGSLGLLLVWRKDRILAVASFIALAVQVYVIGSWEFWHGGSSFGQRFFVNLSPVFMIGLGVFLEWVLQWVRLRVVVVLGSLFAVWNFGLFVQYGLGIIPRMGGFKWPSVLYNQFVFIPSLIWKRILLPLSPWSFLSLAGTAALLLIGWIWWNRWRKWQPAG